MKKLTIILAAITLAGCATQNAPQTNNASATNQQMMKVDDSTARTALDWSGTYQGVLPCADCEGIKTTLSLYNDNSFKLEQTYLTGAKNMKPEVSKGKIEWNKTKPLIHLQYAGETHTFFVGEGFVTAYDMNGNSIKSALNYTLKKVK